MKRYQEIEFDKYCKSLNVFLNKLQKKHPKFFEVWGDGVRYNLENGIKKEIDADCGYILHTINDDDYYYICFIATDECQIIND